MYAFLRRAAAELHGYSHTLLWYKERAVSVNFVGQCNAHSGTSLTSMHWVPEAASMTDYKRRLLISPAYQRVALLRWESRDSTVFRRAEVGMMS